MLYTIVFCIFINKNLIKFIGYKSRGRNWQLFLHKQNRKVILVHFEGSSVIFINLQKGLHNIILFSFKNFEEIAIILIVPSVVYWMIYSTNIWTKDHNLIYNWGILQQKLDKVNIKIPRVQSSNLLTITKWNWIPKLLFMYIEIFFTYITNII